MSIPKHGHLGSWNDLLAYGINYLTGEACGYGGRILCDYNKAGKALLEEFFGVEFVPNKPWGSTWDKENPPCGSIMLPKGILWDLCVFCLIRDGWEVVIQREDVVHGFSDADWEEIKDRYFEAYDRVRVYSNSGTAGTRNQHVFSGRVS